MKRWSYAVLMLATVALFSIAPGRGEQVDKQKGFMRIKLMASQQVLEALAVENFDSMAKHAQHISLLTREEGWNVVQTAEYRSRSTEFRRTADRLTAAAKKKNLDGATLAYLDLTQKCVECHKYLRGRE